MHRLSLARSTPYLLVGMIVLGGILRFYGIGDKDLWLDEAFSVWMSRQPLPALFDWLVRIDQHQPLYYTLLHFWLVFGDMAAQVRMLSAMLSHNTAIFFPVAVNLFVLGLLAWRRGGGHAPTTGTFNPPSLSNWLLAQAGVFVCWSPWLAAALIQSIGVYHAFWIPGPSLGTVIAAGKALLNDFWPEQSAWAQVSGVGYALLVILGIVHLRERLAVAVLLLVLILTPFVGELLVSLRRPIFYDRTLIWTTLPLYILLALGFVQMRRKPAFDFYFREFERPLAEHGVPVNLFDRGVLEPQMTIADLPRLQSLLHNRSRVWLIYSHDWYTDPQQLILAALDETFDLTDSQQLRGLQVQLYTAPKPDN